MKLFFSFMLVAIFLLSVPSVQAGAIASLQTQSTSTIMGHHGGHGPHGPHGSCGR